MLKKFIQMNSLLLCFTMAVGCSPSQSKQTMQEKQKSENKMGNDRDEHGCIASAGYQWSELLKDCIRPFEKGIKLISATDEFSQFASFLIVNADSSKVEVFMPKTKERPILIRQKPQASVEIWKAENHPTLSVTLSKGKWKLLENDEVIYEQ